MNSYENLTPQEAWQRQSDQGAIHLDVRTAQEYDEGHAPGTYNVPWLLFHPLMGRQLNEHFANVVRKHWSLDTALVVSCAHGQRSIAACQALLQAGFTKIANCDGGYFGRSTFDGQTLVPGWISAGLPVIAQPEPGHDYESLQGGDSFANDADA